MTLAGPIRAARWMARDTFKQAVGSRLFWVMLAVLLLTTLVCLSARVEGDARPANPGDFSGVLPPDEAARAGEKALADSGVRVAGGTLKLGFGAVTVPVARSRGDAVRYLQLTVAGTLADSAGLLLALLWTAGFLPTFLEPNAAAVMLGKPASRTLILLSKYAGVVLFVTLYALCFVGSTWLALGVATGVWTGGYWLAAPILAANFAIYYSVSAFLAVWTRSTVASAFGVLLFWFVTALINTAHHHYAALPPGAVTAAATGLIDAAYWVFPKPLDYGAVFFDALGANEFAAELPDVRAAREAGRLRPDLAFASGFAFAAATLGLACYEFEGTDY